MPQPSATQIQEGLQKTLNINIEKMATAAGKDEHNLREAWDATVAKVQEFTAKYVN